MNRSIVLYDLTNTYFEGQCNQNPKAQFGRSKEKRSDCPLVTLGLVLDGRSVSVDCAKKNRRVSQDYRIDVIADDVKKRHPD